MSEKRRWFSLGRKPEAPQLQTDLSDGQEIPLLDMESEKTALTSKQLRPSVEQLIAEQTTQLLAEQAVEDALIQAHEKTLEDEIKLKEGITFIQDRIRPLSLAYNDLLSRKATALHITGEARRIGWKKYEVEDWTLDEKGERQYAFRLSYRTQKTKSGSKNFIPDTYSQSLVSQQKLDNPNQQQLEISFKEKDISALTISSNENLKKLNCLKDQQPLLRKLIRSEGHHQEISFDMRHSVPMIQLASDDPLLSTAIYTFNSNDEFTLHRLGSSIREGNDPNTFKLELKNLFENKKEKVDSKMFVDLAKEMLQYIPAKRLK